MVDQKMSTAKREPRKKEVALFVMPIRMLPDVRAAMAKMGRNA